MRICLVGHLEETPVEGTRRVLLELSRWLSRRFEVRTYRISSFRGMVQCCSFKPDVLHAVIGPSSVMSFLALRLWQMATRPRAIVITATHFTLRSVRMANWILRPDAILIQSEGARKKAEDVGWKDCFVPNGVDEKRFVPASDDEKSRLRKVTGLPEDRKTLLHVGPVKYSRNAHWLTDLPSEKCTLLILSRPSDPGDADLMRALTERGARIITEFMNDVERIYQVSDGLVFPPTDQRSCIETPLSVLEAMSCNLPIVSTRFGALPLIIEKADGMHFVEDREELVETSLRLGVDCVEPRTREAIQRYSWERITDRIADIYSKVL